MGITWMESVTMIKNKTHVTAYSDDGDSNTTSGSKPPDTTQDQQLGCACAGYLLKTTSRS